MVEGIKDMNNDKLNILIDMDLSEQMLDKIKSAPEVGKIDVLFTDEEPQVFPKDILVDKQVIICGELPINFDDMTSLKFIQLYSAGYSQLPGPKLIERGIRASNARGVHDVPIAEWNICMMINLARDVRAMIRNQETGTWDRSPRFQREIRGCTVGIWGYGGLGRQTARLAKAMGLTVYALDAIPIGPQPDYYHVPGAGDPEGILPDQVFISGQETEFLSNLDFLILTMPLNKKTKGIVGEKELQSLPKTAFILNPARGPLVEEEALLKALREGWIAGAALDTHYYYPMPADHPLWGFPNVIMTPHISGSTGSTRFVERAVDILLQNLERFKTGRPLLNELTNEQLNS